ncbi:cytochrome P450 [Phaeosphaeria sp. MPI-PUGE-AT-0046c]|nr:cytochrome P450 [Phaeosphaeria sp. MPI-PUGE-AT-0046c]
MPIYTIYLLGLRLYIKQYKSLAFPPLEAIAAKNICGSSKVANDVLDHNVNGDDGPRSYSASHHPAVRVSLLPGPGLDAMNRVIAKKVVASISEIKLEKSVKLFVFISHEITIATTDSVKVQPGVMILLLGLFPSVLAAENGGHLQGSALVKTRVEHSLEYGIPIEDIARYETGGALGVLTNTSPSSFWMILHVYSDELLLGECRKELAKMVSDNTFVNEKGETKTMRTLDMTSVKTACPIMLSVFQEVLRTYSVSGSARLVMEDHLLDGKYLLKKGGTLMIPGPVQHTSSDAFGSAAGSFDHRRFMPGSRTHNPVAFRAFGGGTTLCPGRHFATTEILAFTALMILRCDVKPDSGIWVCPTRDNAGLWESTPMPDFDIGVSIKPRTHTGGNVEWRVLFTDSDKVIKLSAEDM